MVTVIYCWTGNFTKQNCKEFIILYGKEDGEFTKIQASTSRVYSSLCVARDEGNYAEMDGHRGLHDI